jgi:hypothetical protein
VIASGGWQRQISSEPAEQICLSGSHSMIAFALAKSQNTTLTTEQISHGEQHTKPVTPIYKFRTNQDTPYSSYSLNWFGQPLGHYNHEDSIVFETSKGCHLGYVLELMDSGLKVADDFGVHVISSKLDVMPAGFMTEYTSDRIFANPDYA